MLNVPYTQHKNRPNMLTRFILTLTFSSWSKVQALIIVSQGTLTVTDFKEETPEGVQGIN